MRCRLASRWHQFLFLACLVWASVAPAVAQNLESVLSPGAVIQGHAKVESECKRCHVRFDRAAQDKLCIDCHKEVGQDVAAKTGFHGRQKPQPCRACHTDHKGRDMHIVDFDPKTFDHAQSDYGLRGKHSEVKCNACHLPGKKFRQAPQDCVGCHRKDDIHKAALGTACADCHTERRWNEAKFDHDTTHFALTGKHVQAKCADCHKPNEQKQVDYKAAPSTCIGCHRKDDKHKARFGEACDSCHNVRDWRLWRFDHQRQTDYPLEAGHAPVACEACHNRPAPAGKPAAPLQRQCVACHRQDDIHSGDLGQRCEQCHRATTWKQVDHRPRAPLPQAASTPPSRSIGPVQ